MPVVGDVLAARYELKRRLGVGGMGVVFEALDTRTNTRVAVKTMHADLAHSADGLARFRREVRAAARIVHPAVVHTLDVGETEGGEAYLVMELLEGASLSHAISARRAAGSPISPRLVCGVLLEILRGVAAAHEVGVVHRDLKPDNVFLARVGDDGWTLKLLDFGVSKLREAGASLLTRTGLIVGTPFYMAPEQAKGGDVDPRADVYAVGAIGYELLTGVRPFSDRPPHLLLYAIASERPVPASDLAPGAPRALLAWIDRAMARDPNDRFPSAIAAARALEATNADFAHSNDGEDDDPIAELAVTGSPLSDGFSPTIPARTSRGALQSQGTLPPEGRRIDAAGPSTAITPRLLDSATRVPSSPSNVTTRARSDVRRASRARDLVSIGVSAALGAIVGIVIAHFGHPLPTAGFDLGDPRPGIVLDGLVLAVAWFALAAVARTLPARTNESRAFVGIGVAEVGHELLRALGGVAPTLATHLPFSLVGPAAILLATRALVRLLVGERRAVRFLDPILLVVLFAVGRSAALQFDGGHAHADLAYFALQIPAIALAFLLGAVELVRARAVAAVDRRRRAAAFAVGVVVYAVAKIVHLARLAGVPTEGFALVELIAPVLMLFGGLAVDEAIDAHPRGLEGVLRVVQRLVALLVSFFVAAFALLCAHDLRPEALNAQLALPSISALVAIGLAWRLLRVESPTSRTTLLGSAIGAFGVYQLSIVYAVFGEPTRIVWWSRACNVWIIAFPCLAVMLLGRSGGRRPTRLVEWTAILATLCFMPYPLTDRYFIGVRRFSFGWFAQGGAAQIAFDVFASACANVAVTLGLRAALDASGKERANRAVVVGGFVVLALLCLGDTLPALGISFYPTTNFAFVPIAAIAYGSLRADHAEVGGFVRRASYRAVVSLFLGALVAILLVAIDRWTDDAPSPWIGAAAVATIVVVAIEPLWRTGQELIDRLLGVEAIDEREAMGALVRVISSGSGRAAVVQHACDALGRALEAHSVVLLDRDAAGSFTCEGIVLPADHDTVARLRTAMIPIRFTPAPEALAHLGDDLVFAPVPLHGEVVSVLVVAPSSEVPLRSRRTLDFLARFASLLGVGLAAPRAPRVAESSVA